MISEDQQMQNDLLSHIACVYFFEAVGYAVIKNIPFASHHCERFVLAQLATCAQ